MKDSKTSSRKLTLFTLCPSGDYPGFPATPPADRFCSTDTCHDIAFWDDDHRRQVHLNGLI